MTSGACSSTVLRCSASLAVPRKTVGSRSNELATSSSVSAQVRWSLRSTSSCVETAARPPASLTGLSLGRCRPVAGRGRAGKASAHHRLGGLGALRVSRHGREEVLAVECIQHGIGTCGDGGRAMRVPQEGDLAEVATGCEIGDLRTMRATSSSPSATM